MLKKCSRSHSGIAVEPFYADSDPGAVSVLLVSGGSGVYDEWLQFAVPGRYGSLSDWMLDLFGALIEVELYRYLAAPERNSD